MRKLQTFKARPCICKVMQLQLYPHVAPFIEGRALFVCNFTIETLTAIKIWVIKMPITIMYLNKYHRSVNTIVTEIFQFRGWISIKGLPFDSRCTNTFEIIDNQCGGLMRIDRKTSKFHFLIEASVRVKAKGIVAIPQIIHFGSQGTNIPIMLTPLFTLETAFQSTSNTLSRVLSQGFQIR